MFKTTEPTAAHLAYRHAIEQAMRDHGATLDALELLAITSHLVGQLIALQDRRKVTPALALEVVQRNLEQGNAEVIASLRDAAPGGTA
jgi:hypothetical protein